MNKLLTLLLLVVVMATSTMGFSTAFTGTQLQTSSVKASSSSSQLNMFFGKKDDGSPGDYVCKVSLY
jgi:hypothetical protein